MQPTSTFTSVNALTTLLTVESLLFAAFALAVNLSVSVGRVRRGPFTTRTLVSLAVGCLTVISVGAVAAWWDVFGPWRMPHDVTRTIIGLSILLAAVGQPALGVLLALGTRPAE